MYVVRWLRAVQVPSMGHISDLSLEFSAPEALLSLRRSERPTALPMNEEHLIAVVTVDKAVQTNYKLKYTLKIL